MIRDIKSILIGLTKEFGPNEDTSALPYGLSLAQSSGAHVTVEAAAVKVVLSTAGVSGMAAALVRGENHRLQASVEAIARQVEAEAASAGIVCTTQTPQLEYTKLLSNFSQQARLHDLTILDAEASPTHLDRGLFEAILTESGRPVLVVPPGRRAFSCRRVILAWDGSAKAARATGDALPFLAAAEAVRIVSVIGEKELLQSVMGAEIAPNLVRHGVNVEVDAVSAAKGDVAGALREAAEKYQADMIVMGGYVHSRLRELLLGGVTQSLLRQCEVPILMSY